MHPGKLSLLGLLVSAVLIICGALLTSFCGEKWHLHLREGETSSERIPFELRLDSFRISYSEDGESPKDYISAVTILPDSTGRIISMNHILRHKGYRFYQEKYDPDLHGSTLFVSHDPWGTGLVYAGYILFFFAFLGWLISKKAEFKIPRSLLFVLPVLFLAVTGIVAIQFSYDSLSPVLRTPLLYVHVLIIAFSYLLFGIIAICGNPARALLYPAVFLLATGIIIGSAWANISWGSYWSWDPKETSALVTLLVYSAALLPIDALKRPRVFRIYSIFAFLFVLFTWLGVIFLLGGMHSYLHN